MRTILLNFMLKVDEGNPIPEAASKKLIEWADANKMKRALECAGEEFGAGGADAAGAVPSLRLEAIEPGFRRDF